MLDNVAPTIGNDFLGVDLLSQYDQGLFYHSSKGCEYPACKNQCSHKVPGYPVLALTALASVPSLLQFQSILEDSGIDCNCAVLQLRPVANLLAGTMLLNAGISCKNVCKTCSSIKQRLCSIEAVLDKLQAWDSAIHVWGQGQG